MARIQVREAVEADAEALAALVARLKSLNEELDPHFKVVGDLDKVALEYVKASIGSDKVILLVAEDAEAGEVAGLIRVELVDRVFYEPRVKAVITDIYVRPKYRRRRVGRLLLEKAAEEAARRGAGIITAVYPAGNVIAARFYQQMGFTRLQEEVYKPLKS